MAVISPGALLDDGLLDVMCVTGTPAGQVMGSGGHPLWVGVRVPQEWRCGVQILVSRFNQHPKKSIPNKSTCVNVLVGLHTFILSYF